MDDANKVLPPLVNSQQSSGDPAPSMKAQLSVKDYFWKLSQRKLKEENKTCTGLTSAVTSNNNKKTYQFSLQAWQYLSLPVVHSDPQH